MRASVCQTGEGDRGVMDALRESGGGSDAGPLPCGRIRHREPRVCAGSRMAVLRPAGQSEGSGQRGARRRPGNGSLRPRVSAPRAGAAVAGPGQLRELDMVSAACVAGLATGGAEAALVRGGACANDVPSHPGAVMSGSADAR